jgi:alpha-galactosidase
MPSRSKAALATLVTVAMTTLACGSQDQITQGAEPGALANGLARTPPMGWNSWNKFGCSINETIVKGMADAMVSSGMAAAGYQYVNVDDCWQGSRDSSGSQTSDPTRFPSGLEALADYVHAKGLKFGIYSDAGSGTCCNYPGMLGHEQQDANTFASWGIDYVKVDWCNTGGLSSPTQYGKIRDALASTGRPILLSICNWGIENVWDWGPTTGNMWRTTGDISDSWTSMLSIMDSNSQHASAAGPGSWNDPDMLEIGNGGMSATEYRSHMSMWAIMAAPLIAGNDLRSMTQETHDILTNPEVIAVDQDPAGVQGVKVAEATSGLQVWSKKLQRTGARAVALLNRTSGTANITVNWSAIGLASGSATVRDLWGRTALGSFSDGYTASVPSHGTALLEIVGTEASGGDTVAPTAPSNVAVSNKTSTSVSLTWNAASDNVGVTGYEVLLNDAVVASATRTAATVNALDPSTAYTFAIRSKDAAGNVSAASSPVSCVTEGDQDTTPPAAPSNLVWANVGMTVTMTWGPSTDDVGVVAYDFYFGSYYIGSTTTPSATLIGFKAATQYNFTVKARDAAGNVSVASNQITVLLSPGQDTTPPAAPTNLRSTSVASTSIGLSWTASIDDVGVVIYQVYLGSAQAKVSTSPFANVSGLTPGTGYTITVKALDAAGNASLASAPLVVTTTSASSP